MGISAWFQNWFSTRKAEQRAVGPADHSARLFVRRLEDRQVLSVSAVLVGTDVTFTGDDGGASADSIVFTIDRTGHLEHNLGGINGFNSNIDLDNTLAGDQVLAVSDITHLDVHLGADADAVDFADHFDFAAGNLSVSAESIRATLGSLSVQGLTVLDAGATNTILLLGVNDFHTVQIVSANNVFLNDTNDLTFSGASSIAGDLEVTFGSLITNDVGASLSVGDQASFSGGAISLGGTAGDSINFGRLNFDSTGAVSIEEDSATELWGDNSASTLHVVSTGTITDDSTSLQVAGLASFMGTSIDLGGATNVTDFGSLNIHSIGAVVVHEDSATVFAGDSSALRLRIDSTGDITDTSTSFTVTNLAEFHGTSITLGGAASHTEFGTLSFNTAGDVSIQVDASTELVGDNLGLSLVLDSTGAITDSSTSLSVTGLADFSGSSITVGGAASTTNFGTLSFRSSGAVAIQEDSATEITADNSSLSLFLESTGVITDSSTSLNVTGLADLTGSAITVGGAASTTNFGTLSFHSSGAVAIQEDSSTEITGNNSALSLVLNSTGDITDSSTSLSVTGLADISGSSIAVGGAASNTNFGSLSFHSHGAVAIQEDSATEIVGDNSALSLVLDSTGDISDSSIRLIVTALADFSGSSITVGGAASTTNVGNLSFHSHGVVTLQEDSATEFVGNNSALSLRIDSAGDVSDTSTTFAVSNLAEFHGTTITLGGAASHTEIGMLNFDAPGDVSIQVDASTELVGDNSALGLVLDSTGGITDSSTSLNVTGLADFSGSSIEVGGAASNTNFGALSFHSSGAVTIQEDSSTLVNAASTAGSLDLKSVGNVDLNSPIDVANDALIQADLAITVAGDFTSGGTASLLAQDDVTVNALVRGAAVSIEAGGNITVNAAVEAVDSIELTAGLDGSGSVKTTLASQLAADNTGNTSTIQIQSGAVSGNVLLTGATSADSLVKVVTAENINGGGLITAETIELLAATGIGNSVALQLSGATITAQSTQGNIDLNNAVVSTFALVTTGTGTIQIDNTGAATFTTVTTADGAIRLNAIGGNLIVGTNVTAGGADVSDNVTLTTTTTSDIVLTGTATASGNTVSAVSAGSILGGGLVSAERVDLQAQTGISSNLATISIKAATDSGGVTLTNTASGPLTTLDLTTGGNAQIRNTGALALHGTVDGNLAVILDSGDLTDDGVLNISGSSTLQLLQTNADITLDTLSATGPVSLSTLGTSGNVTITNAVSLALEGTVNGNLAATATTGDLTDSGPLTVRATSSLAAAGDVILDHAANDFAGVITVAGQVVELVDANRVTLGQAGAVTLQVTASGLITIGTGAGEDLVVTDCVLLNSNSGGVVEAAGSMIVTDRLALVGTGTFTLNQANDVDVLAANVDGAMSYSDSNSLIIGTACGVSGLTTTNDDLHLTTGGDLTIGEAGDGGVSDISLGTGNLTLQVTGAITQFTGNTISAAGLQIIGHSGAVRLEEANSVTTLAVDRDGTVSFHNDGSLAVGTVTDTALLPGTTSSGISTSGDDVRLTVDGNLQIGQQVNLGTANLSLDVAGTISQSHGGTITASGLALSGSGSASGADLSEANDVDTLASNYQGSLFLHDIDGLTVGSLSDTATPGSPAVRGISTISDVKLVSEGGLHFAESAQLGTGNLFLEVVGPVTQSAVGTIHAGGLALKVAGPTTLDQANDVNTLAADTLSSVVYHDVDDLVIGVVSETASPSNMSITGITVDDANLSISNATGNLTVDQSVSASGVGDVTLTAESGQLTLNAGVGSDTGDIALAGDAVTQNADVTTRSAGTIRITADRGALVMSDGTITSTDAGAITLSATGDVAITRIQSLDGPLSITSDSEGNGTGAIRDNSADEFANLTTTGLVTLRAGSGIGATDDLDTAVTRLDITNTTSGAIQIAEVDALQITQLSQAGRGDAQVRTTTGSITVDNAHWSPNAIAVTGGGSLVLDANGTGADIVVNDGIRSNGDVTLLADRDIVTNSAPVISTGADGDVTFTAGRDIRILDPGNHHPVDVAAAGTGTASLRAAHQLVLGSQNPADPDTVQNTTLNDVVVASGTGSITNTLPILFDVLSPQVTAEGEAVLSVTIGRPGETNLSVRIYWGDGTVETFSGLTAGTHTYNHFYRANPNPLDPAAPILVNVQVAHDPRIVLVAPNVNSSVVSVRDNAVDVPPPVPVPNINADLARAIYNSSDPLYSTLQTQVVSSPGSEAAPGTVVFQDTVFRATAIPVPGEGLATFVFDTTPPVVMLDFPEGVKIVDTQPQTAVQVSQGNAAQLVAEVADDTASGERQVILEVISPAGEVIQQAVLPESTLDDLQEVIGRLPDGQYRFQLKEAGEDRLRLLLEFEVRQGKIADETDASDRPPSTKKLVPASPMEQKPVEMPPDQDGALMLQPTSPTSEGEFNETSLQEAPRSERSGSMSIAARLAWKRAAESIPAHSSSESDTPDPQPADDESDASAMALGVMVGVIGAGWVTPLRNRPSDTASAPLSRVSRLWRRVQRLRDSGPPETNVRSTPRVSPFGEWPC